MDGGFNGHPTIWIMNVFNAKKEEKKTKGLLTANSGWEGDEI